MPSSSSSSHKHPRSRLFRGFGLAATALAVALGTFAASYSSAEETRKIPPPVFDEPTTGNAETAIFAGGCFWGVQGVFQHVEGVTEAVSGYAGGSRADAKYKVVGTGRTGHAESVRVTFDPQKISYGRMLQIYFSVAHNPTELNRQGPDRGTQYRSAIFPMSEEQAKVAKAYVTQLDAAKVFSKPIATTIEPGHNFFAAEAYHQNYLTLNPTYPYIVINDIPKIEALKRIYPEVYRADPVLVATTKETN